MLNTSLTILLSAVMGLSIFGSLPILFRKGISLRKMLIYNAFAIGILVFLLLDMYGDVASIFGGAGLPDPLEIVFIAAFSLSFILFAIPKSSRDPDENPKRTSLLAAVGIGFQNLTEGLVFGSAGAAGLVPIYLISIFGFTLQNATEGFPIAIPLVGSKRKIEKKFIISAFLIGGVPTILGTLIGISYYSAMFIVVFDALASAAILYVVLVLFHVNINRSREAGKSGKAGMDTSMLMTYLGIMAGFAVAFILNYVVA